MSGAAPPAIIELLAGEARVRVVPAIGGAIASYTWRDLDILRPAPGTAISGSLVRQMASYPLVPYSNRIGDAKLLFNGEVHALRPNFPPEPNAIHGVGWQRPWQSSRRTASSVRLDLAHAPDADWPFRFEAHQVFSLGADALEVRLGLRNTDARPMPAGLGFHPFFPLRPGVHLQAEWRGMWKAGHDKLPSEWIPVPQAPDFRELRPVESWEVDNVFTGWRRRALLDYATHRVELRASEALARIVCFAPNDGRAFLALEPVSHVNNAFAMAAGGVADTGMRVLAPGESWDVSMTITVGGGGR